MTPRASHLDRDQLKRLIRHPLPFLGLVCALAACSGGLSPTEPARLSIADVEFQSFQMVNEARRDGGVEPPLELAESISTVARAHSEAMRDEDFFGHVDSNGNEVGGRLGAAGVGFTRAGENLARVSGSGNPAATAHALLMGSGGHRDNILSADFRLVGVGAARRGDTFWITQVFIQL